MTNPHEKQAKLLNRLKERYGDPTVELHTAYDPWLEDQARRPGSRLKPFAFDLDQFPEQDIYVPVLEADPAYPRLPDNLYYLGFGIKMSRSLGGLALVRLRNQMRHQPSSVQDPTPLTDRLNNNQRIGRNTVVVPSHINFQELGYVRAMRHLAKRDRQVIPQNGVVFNKLMTRQEYKGRRLTEHFQPVGNIHYSYPKSASTVKYDIPSGAMMLGNGLFMASLNPYLEAGGYELDVALAGSEIKPVCNEDGEISHYKVPEVDPSSARLLEGFDDAVSVTLIGPPVLDEWHMHIGEVLDVKELLKTHSSADVTDMLYGDIAGAVERFTKRDVVYNKVAVPLGKVATNSSE